MSPRGFLIALLTPLLLICGMAPAEGWKAGVAKAVITPEGNLWMSGYAARNRPADGKLHDLWAKALVLEDERGNRLLMLTADLCGVDRDLSLRIRDAIRRKHGLDKNNIAFCVSHTHSGPVVGNNLRAMYFLSDEQVRLVDAYTEELEKKLLAIADEAIDALEPARLEWGNGRATFAVNRRNNSEANAQALRAEGKLVGPVDHDLPVLRVLGPDGSLKAVIFGYACHATTLNGYQWSNDWPGYALIEIEKNHPGATALFFAGCGADQNPLPRRTVALAENYGKQAADGVEAVLAEEMNPISGSLAAAYSEIDLPYASLPNEEQLKTDLQSADRYVASRANHLLHILERDGKLPAAYPYPVQAWQLGDGPTLVLLGGEVVVDYSLRLKKELGPDHTWVAAYANDVMAYIPSRRVLEEGGYEGGGAMVYYGLPSPWAAEVEELVVNEVHRLAKEVRK